MSVPLFSINLTSMVWLVGWQPKMVESFLKGGVLLFAKDAIIRSCKAFGLSDVPAGLLGGFGGGVAQVTVSF
jgi:hypothetical protein